MPKIPKKLTQKKSKPPVEEMEEDKKVPTSSEKSTDEGTDSPESDESDSDEDEEDTEDGDEEEPAPKLQSSREKEKEPAKDEEYDYLQRYQYKKVNNQPMLGGPLTNPDPGSKAAIMKDFLLSEPRISTLIPLPEGTDPKVPFSVTRNGYRLDLPTNAYIDVPKSIIEMIRESNNATIVALSQYQIDKDNKNLN